MWKLEMFGFGLSFQADYNTPPANKSEIYIGTDLQLIFHISME